MRMCMDCRKFEVAHPKHDFCPICWSIKESADDITPAEDCFRMNLFTQKIYTVYVLTYGSNYKIGYTNDLNSRLIEIKKQFKENELVYFREFTHESKARRYEDWLKKCTERQLIKFISAFQDKIKKVQMFN